MSQTDGTVDTWEMVMIHRVFRRELGLVPGLIRRVGDGDRRRSAVVAEHFAFLVDGLHHHHGAEDELLWPMLLARVGELDGDLVVRMQRQHETVATLIARAGELLPEWRSTAAAAAGEDLANVVEKLCAALGEHLADEENEILPLCSRHLTQAEWDTVGERGSEGMPKGRRLFVALGAILEEATPEERRRFFAKAPMPARVLWSVVGKRVYRREMARIHG